VRGGLSTYTPYRDFRKRRLDWTAENIIEKGKRRHFFNRQKAVRNFVYLSMILTNK